MKTFLFPLFVGVALLLAPDLFALADLAPAHALVAKKDFAAAADALEKIVEAEPNHAEAWLELGHTQLARVQGASLYRKGRLATQGLAAFRKAAELDPKSVPARASLICYYSQAPFFVGGSRSKARAEARELVALDAFGGNFWLMRLALDDGRPGEAFAACEAMLTPERRSDHAVGVAAQTCAVTKQQLEEGEVALQRALTLTPKKNDPARAAAFEWLGRALEEKGDVAGAVGAYESALKLSPEQKGAHERLAKLK